MSDFKTNQSELNLFFLSTSLLYMGQHSGAQILPNSCNVLAINVNSFPFNNGTYNKNDIVLPKNIYKNNKKIHYLDLIKNYPSIIWLYSRRI